MAVNGSGPIKKTGNKPDDGEFMQYCDSIVERALAAVDTIIRNRAKKNRGR